MMFLWLLLSFASLPRLSSALENPQSDQRTVLFASEPIPPSQDLWYTAPQNYELALPGTILRMRPAPGNLTTIIANCSAAYNILYRTTDSHHSPSWAVTTLYTPLTYTAKPALLSYEIAYNTADVDYSVSYIMYSQASAYPEIPRSLSSGWFVNVPDFEGPKASYGAGILEGYATLDSVRASLRLLELFGIEKPVRSAMWGYSGGSIGCGWAAELQKAYAPELNFAGMAMGGIVANGTQTLELLNNGPYSGLFAIVLLGFMTEFPDAQSYIISQLKTTGSQNRTSFLKAKNMSLPQSLSVFLNQDMFGYFVDGEKVLDSPIVQRVETENSIMGQHGVPQMPVFAYKAIADELSLVENSDNLVSTYCKKGANILYQRNKIGGHLAEATNGDVRAFEWLTAVLTGTYADNYKTKGCTVQNGTWGTVTLPL